MIRVGMHVKYIGDTTYRGSEKIPNPPDQKRIGIVTGFYGREPVFSGGADRNWWYLDINPKEIFDENTLVPINPDNEAWGSFEDMMKEFTKDAVLTNTK